MSRTYKFIERNSLAATCRLDGAGLYVRVKAEAWLDVQRLYADDDKLFRKISTDFERGYRTTDNEVVCALEDSFLQWAGGNRRKPPWEMSYIGKAKIKVYVPELERLNNLDKEVKGLIELMESKVTHYTTFDNYLVAESPVSKSELKYEDRRGRKRAVPVVDHQFQQLRPLLLTTFKEWEAMRREVCRSWADRPLIPLEW